LAGTPVLGEIGASKIAGMHGVLSASATPNVHSRSAGPNFVLRTLAATSAAVIAVTHDEKIFDRFDRMFMLRDGRLDDVVQLPNAA